LKTSVLVKSIIVVLICAFAIGGSYYMSRQKAPATNDTRQAEQDFYTLLSEKNDADGATAVGEFVTLAIKKDPRHIAVALDWARDHSIKLEDTTRLHGFNYMLYADMAYLAAQAFMVENMQDKFVDLSKTAFSSLLMFDILTATDAARCGDKTVGDIRMMLVTPRYDALEYVYEFFTEDDIKNLQRAVLIAESAMWQRPPNRDICATGSDAKIDMIEKSQVQKNTSEKAGQMILPKGYKYQPVYIDNDAWMRLREAAQLRVSDEWYARYQAYQIKKMATPDRPVDTTP